MKLVRPLRVFIYVQHLSGVGHMVRAQQIGQALARKHEVTILDGGSELVMPDELMPVQVPRLTRRAGKLAVLNADMPLSQAQSERAARLDTALQGLRPDVILVEHFPFSKWELADELLPLLTTARRRNTELKIVASLRDISLRTQHETPEHYPARVISYLHDHFDALLVHGDPALCSLGNYFEAAERIEIPVFHTGIVAARAKPIDAGRRRELIGTDDYVVLSSGGGPDRGGLVERTLDAWLELDRNRAGALPRLLVFSGVAGLAPEAAARLKSLSGAVDMGFAPDFPGWLEGASLSISCAGYNTCANLLATRTPALLAPDPIMSDQRERARLLIEAGIALPVPEKKNAGQLAQLIQDNLGRGKVEHSIDIDGAAASLCCIEQLVSGFPGQ